MSLITENNRQYYEGAQGFKGDGVETTFTTTFNTDLKWFAASNAVIDYALNNFKLYTSANGLPGSWSEIIADYSVSGNTITFTTAPTNGLFIVAQLKTLEGGNYGNSYSEKAYGDIVEDNYGSYSYIKLSDVINNFIVAYVGVGKLIQSVKRTDVIFHAKRAMQEFSYDTLKSVNSQELSIPNSLSVAIPQDYVNYVNIYWVDSQGIKHIILPTTLTSNPGEIPLQAYNGQPIQDNFGDNTEGTSITEERWANNATQNINDSAFSWDRVYDWEGDQLIGQRYGLDPQHANINGSFTINEREGKFSFSADLVDKIIILEYISDGLSTNMDTRVPKMAEEAMYAYISHAVIASRINQPEYVVNRLKREKSAKLRNTKIRLSNIKLNEIVQVTRGQSKWLKH
tara:strand:- start:138 stop:1334 length:1197 start_codon:yes stop_codon:yes gene_type:complete